MDRQAIIEAYEDVRNDQTPTAWLVLKKKNYVIFFS